jgi:hypothetical protein
MAAGFTSLPGAQDPCNWKMPADGGQPVQITKGGVADSSESPDGGLLYYTKVGEIGPGLWSVSSDGERKPRFWVQCGLARMAFTSSTSTSREIGTAENGVAWNISGLAVNPDSHWLLYPNLESTEADLMLVDNFRQQLGVSSPSQTIMYSLFLCETKVFPAHPAQTAAIGR